MPNTDLEFWLTFNNQKEKLRLPVNPEELSVVSTRGYEDVDVSQLGEYTIMGGRKLKEISFSSFFPRDYNPTYCEYEDLPDPWDTVETIERWQSDKKWPIRLIITSSGVTINMAATIRSFEYAERGGNPGDVFFTLSLKEYVFVNFRKVEVPAPVLPKPPEAPKPIKEPAKKKKKAEVKKEDPRPVFTGRPPRMYTPVSQEPLQQISQKFFYTTIYWKNIAVKNNMKPPYLVTPGKAIMIPNPEDLTRGPAR